MDPRPGAGKEEMTPPKHPTAIPEMCYDAGELKETKTDFRYADIDRKLRRH